jgi:predicted ATPase
MTDFKPIHKSVLENYNRPIVHMRDQIESNRFSLFFGSGLSQGCKIPSWKNLVEQLAKDPKVKGKGVLNVVPPRAGLPYKTEMLFENFKKRQYSSAKPEQYNTRELDYKIGADWRELIRKHLYKKCHNKLGDYLKSHPYLKHYLPIIRNTDMTVTYNFDDFIEQSILKERTDVDSGSRGYESVTNPWTQFRHGTAIYHPNGVIPQNPLESPSDRLVFSEESYVKQLIGIFAGDQAGLVSHLSKNTCLLIGLSLEDDTLRNALMQAANSCPGNFHYYVHYLEPGKVLHNEVRNAITLANFKVYNLITLFLNDEGIKALGELIDINNCQKKEFSEFANQHNIKTRFCFYITGALGVGKSTVINNFRNLVALDEWLEQRPRELEKDWETLSPMQREQVDKWIANQFKLKNDILNKRLEGVFVLDRGPLDPLAFTPDSEWNKKAERLLTAICSGSEHRKVQDGRVILLQGEGSELALRMVLLHREGYTTDKLRNMEERLGKAYGTKGIIKFDTRGLTPSDVAHRVAEIIHLEPYVSTCDLHKRLEDIRKDGFNVKD